MNVCPRNDASGSIDRLISFAAIHVIRGHNFDRQSAWDGLLRPFGRVGRPEKAILHITAGATNMEQVLVLYEEFSSLSTFDIMAACPTSPHNLLPNLHPLRHERRWIIAALNMVDPQMAEIYRSKTVTQRIQMMLDANATMRLLIAGTLQTQHPEWNEQTINREVAKRMLNAHHGSG